MNKHYVKNTVTGKIWSRDRGFAIAPMARISGDLVDDVELAVLRATYNNVAIDTTVVLPDPRTAEQEAADLAAFGAAVSR